MKHNRKVLPLAFSFGALAFWAGLRGQFLAFWAALLVLTALTLAYVGNRFVFGKLSLERTLNRRYAPFDAAVTLELAVTNKKILPLFGLKAESTVSPGLEFASSRNFVSGNGSGSNLFFDYFHLNWYERRKRFYELRPLHRGRFELGEGTLSYSDPFGFFANERQSVWDPLTLIVFPKIVPLQGQTALDTYLFGSRPREGWIYTDPLNLVGTRAYQSTDSARRINWKATARHTFMQVNIEKPSFDQQVYLFLEQPPEVKWWVSAVQNKLEVGIMTAASLLESYGQAGYQLNLATNLVSRRDGLRQRPLQAKPDQAQRRQLLTTLALLHSFSVEPASKILAGLEGRIKPGSTAVLISTAPEELDPALVRLLRRLMGRVRVAVLRVSERNDLPKTPGLKEWRIEGGLPWRELASLELS